MASFTNILVNLNAVDAEHPALDQAEALAARMHATITIADVLPSVPDAARTFVSDRIEQELVDHHWDLLKAIAARRGDKVRTVLLRGSKPAISLIQEVQRDGHDLLMRSHGTVSSEPKPFGPTDMQLLRKCPCPVWLVGPSASPRPRRLLAAIDASSNDPGEAALNRAILDLAVTIRDLEDAQLTVLYAWSAFGYQFLERRMSAKELSAFTEATRAAARRDLDAFTSGLGTQVEALLMEGDPHDVIPAYAGSHSIDLVVMGTVGRSGLAGFVMGNTAERILRSLRGSVVAIKPEGFVSPVRTSGVVFG